MRQSEKAGIYTKVPSGLPSIQQSLPVLLTIAGQEDIPLTRIAAVFSENAADLYKLKRGKIRYGYAADIVVFDKDREFTVNDADQYSKCGWSPYEGETLKGVIESVFVNGNEIKYSAYTHDLSLSQLLINRRETKELTIKYYSKYGSNKTPSFARIVIAFTCAFFVYASSG